jgi:ActR/RegA family two-component response regulator
MPDNSPANAADKKAILLVEDMAMLRDVLSEQLIELGYECHCASTCAEGRDAVRERPFACCLIDLGLPDGRGLDLLAEFASIDPNMVPVILTGDGSPGTVIETMRAGAFDFLMKPADITTLSAGIARAINHHEVLHERAMLVELLSKERDELNLRIAAATEDIREYAKSCEASNALLHGLVSLTQLSTGFQNDDTLLMSVFSEIARHLPLQCLALCDVSQDEFLSAVRTGDDGKSEVIVSSGENGQTGLDSILAVAEPQLLTHYWIDRHTDLDPTTLASYVYPQDLWNGPVCMIGFYFDADCEADESEKEFLGMCAHFTAFEWQRLRLLLHAAQHATLGNIALEVSKSFLQSLTAIRTASDVLSETIESEDAAEGLAIIGKNVEFLAGQTQVFHTLSHGRSDSVETVQLDDFINEALELLAMSITSRGVRVEKDFDEDNQCVLLNGTALTPTFLDLISNAIRTVEVNGSIFLSLQALDDDHIQCQISHNVANPGMFGLADVGNTQSLLELVKGHPSFMLAQRTVNTCGGKLTLEREGESRNTFQIVLPRNAMKTSMVQEPTR